jgi:hypothetical protein
VGPPCFHGLDAPIISFRLPFQPAGMSYKVALWDPHQLKKKTSQIATTLPCIGFLYVCGTLTTLKFFMIPRRWPLLSFFLTFSTKKIDK